MHLFEINFRRGESLCGVKLTGKRIKDGLYTYKQNAATHTHILDARDIEVKEVMRKAKEKAKNTDTSSRALYAESLSGTPDEVVGQMPKANAFGKSMRNKRKGNHPPAPKTLDELAPLDSANILTTTGECFLLYDSRNDLNHHETSDRIILFATKTGLEFLTLCEQVFMDGTFTSGPSLFEQMYTIHGM